MHICRNVLTFIYNSVSIICNMGYLDLVGFLLQWTMNK